MFSGEFFAQLFCYNDGVEEKGLLPGTANSEQMTMKFTEKT
jgi:hypothetical protein